MKRFLQLQRDAILADSFGKQQLTATKVEQISDKGTGTFLHSFSYWGIALEFLYPNTKHVPWPFFQAAHTHTHYFCRIPA